MLIPPASRNPLQMNNMIYNEYHIFCNRSQLPHSNPAFKRSMRSSRQQAKGAEKNMTSNESKKFKVDIPYKLLGIIDNFTALHFWLCWCGFFLDSTWAHYQVKYKQHFFNVFFLYSLSCMIFLTLTLLHGNTYLLRQSLSVYEFPRIHYIEQVGLKITEMSLPLPP